MKKRIVIGLGVLLIACGVIYGFTGFLVPSIQSRGDNIARWEREIAQDAEKVKAAIDEADRLGKQPASASGEQSPFERKLADIEYMNQNLKSTRDMIDYERGRRKEMSIITAVLAGLGLLAVVFGLRMRR
jgi:predicted PurR-regulated permease PerM